MGTERHWREESRLPPEQFRLHDWRAGRHTRRSTTDTTRRSFSWTTSISGGSSLARLRSAAFLLPLNGPETSLRRPSTDTYLMYDPWGPQVFNASRGLWQRTGLLGGDGRHVPAELISPVSKAILAMIPMPNRPSVAGSSSLNNYAFASSSRQSDFRIGVRVDHNISNTQRVNGRIGTFSGDQSSTPTMDTPLYTSNITQVKGGKIGQSELQLDDGPDHAYGRCAHRPRTRRSSLEPRTRTDSKTTSFPRCIATISATTTCRGSPIRSWAAHRMPRQAVCPSPSPPRTCLPER